MKYPIHRFVGPVALLLTAALGGCGSSDVAKEALKCPLPSVLAETSTVSVMAQGAALAPANTMLTAEMAPPALACDYDQDDKQVDIDVRFPIRVSAGPAGAQPQTQQLTYFVAQVDSDNNIIVKRSYAADISLAGGATTIVTADAGKNIFGIATGKKPTDYRLLIGFQLTPEQLAYEQMRRTRTAQ